MLINLISDTVTKPTLAMLEAMMRAEVGDDVFGDDPTVNALQDKAAAMFGHEAALFCPSGTMTNQIALAVHCGRLEEVVCDSKSHIYRAETGAYASNSGIALKLIETPDGKLSPTLVQAAINPTHDWLPKTSLVCLENTGNISGGNIYTMAEMAAISSCAREHGLKIHLDGARIFNAMVELGCAPGEVGTLFDSISVCLSKGLGAPVGSVLLGSRAFITQARRQRKAFGGGMRQAGILAAAGIYALDHHVERLKDDHARAKAIAEKLSLSSHVAEVLPVQTNIVIFNLREMLAKDYLDMLASQGVKASAFGPRTVRMVTHLDFTDEMLKRVLGLEL